ncbi:MAG: cation diffusion facilitator family transporter [Planctomycetota bacterium]
MKHGHSPEHAHGPAGHTHRVVAQKRIVLCIALTGLMMVIEVVGGFLTNSLALISDAGHMMTHFIALGISYLAIRLTMRPPTDQRSYGYFRAEILAAFTNGIFLIGVTIYLVYEAVLRTINPQTVETAEMLGVATAGLVVNLVTALLLSGAGRRDLNVRAAFLHMIGDTLSSIAIVAGGVVMLLSGWFIIDAVLSGLICVLILYWAYGLLRESVRILLEFAPKGLNVSDVAECLKSLGGVNNVHDIHVWQITSHMYAMTAHIEVGDAKVAKTEEILKEAMRELDERFRIEHVVLQFETGCCKTFENSQRDNQCCRTEK